MFLISIRDVCDDNLKIILDYLQLKDVYSLVNSCKYYKQYFGDYLKERQEKVVFKECLLYDNGWYPEIIFTKNIFRLDDNNCCNTLKSPIYKNGKNSWRIHDVYELIKSDAGYKSYTIDKNFNICLLSVEDTK